MSGSDLVGNERRGGRRRVMAVLLAAAAVGVVPVATSDATAASVESAAAAVTVGGLVCPVRGYTGYVDSWGAPRSGGRTHEGVDLMASAGTPLVAVTSGYVRFWFNTLGGQVASLYGLNGTRYYYAHLSRFEGWGRFVRQGEVIGYVGATGNAGAPHLHFEVHPGGGAAVNPYPYARAARC